MHLSPKEIDKLALHTAGVVAQKRYARGLRLNYTETVALLSSQLLEFIRDGRSVADLMDRGKKILGFADVMSGVADMLPEVQVEGTFPDGSKLVTVHHPICNEHGDADLALYGSGLERRAVADGGDRAMTDAPGETLLEDEPIVINSGRRAVSIDVMNTGDRPVQVGSHYPFFETNPQLRFDRGAAYGMRLDIAAGTAVRFEPGEMKTVDLVAIDGECIVYGGNNLIAGAATDAAKGDALRRANAGEFLTTTKD